ncbi:hypothetical protein D1007_52290 [Hordeum vulgare]|nr:hypothetical protein D1007_52290 [Hordeum vulgare]
MEVVAAMPPKMRDDAVLRTLLGACVMHNEVDAAREVGEALAKSDGSFGSDSEGYYKVLANVFASGGMWEEMAGVWKAMKGSNVRKTPGVSQIVVDVTTHTFFSRDQMHPQCAEIYEMLDDTLVPQMMKTDLPTETVIKKEEEEEICGRCRLATDEPPSVQAASAVQYTPTKACTATLKASPGPATSCSISEPDYCYGSTQKCKESGQKDEKEEVKGQEDVVLGLNCCCAVVNVICETQNQVSLCN